MVKHDAVVSCISGNSTASAHHDPAPETENVSVKNKIAC